LINTVILTKVKQICFHLCKYDLHGMVGAMLGLACLFSLEAILTQIEIIARQAFVSFPSKSALPTSITTDTVVSGRMA
jgi:hypothetical protein